MNTVKRLCAGEYEVTDGVRTCSISRHEHLDPRFGQWVVRCDWDRDIYSDPLMTLAGAKANAGFMLELDLEDES